ncbi:MAG: GNAT family N-acetyltransferase [Negativicutes bacterium]|nr:GNAT family N-acetyltransferase [Negativicutes bacterium]
MVEKSYRVRPIQKEDIQAVQTFLMHQLKTLFFQDNQGAITDDVWGLEKMYLQPERNNLWVVFDQDGKVVGTGAICTYNDRIECMKGRYHLPEIAEIGRCYVDETIRRQGIGSEIMAAMVKFCQEKEYKKMYLHTHHFLPGGFNFWQKQGFEILIDDGHDGGYETIHMEKIL